MKIVSAVVISILLLFGVVFNSFAQSSYNFKDISQGEIDGALLAITPVRFLISNPFFIFITFKENVNLFFQPSALKKSEFNMIIAGKRVKEAYLLSQESDFDNSARTLKLYSDRLGKMTSQLEKARSQNQDISKTIGVFANNLGDQEILLAAILQMSKDKNNDFSTSTNFSLAVTKYIEAVWILNNISPGIKDRYSLTKEASQEAAPVPTPTPTPFLQEGSSSVKLRRIIY